MLNSLSVLACLFFAVQAHAQRFSVESLFFLPETVSESSGLIFVNDRLITHNDSGNKARLYEIDPESGFLIREVDIQKVRNGDWEDLAIDQEFIYIADIGNNQGDRTDLKIYRISLQDYLLGSNTLAVDSINFSYQDQTNFNSGRLTNFDAGALISLGDSLYIFTKNWIDQHTNIYSLPKTPGDYQAKRIGRINTEGLVAGAVYNPQSDEIILIGYNLQNAFLMRIWNFEIGRFDQGQISRFNFEIEGSFQIEAIELIDETDYYITSESNDMGEARLWRINTDFVVGLDDYPEQVPLVYPNPVQHHLHFKGLEEPVETLVIYNMMGEKIKSLEPSRSVSTPEISVDLMGVPQGVYQLKITTKSKKIHQRFMVEY